MSRTNIDFGIDLGTTNSAISVLRNARPEVLKNNRNQEITPSAVAITRSNSIRVGLDARVARHSEKEEDQLNAQTEFKREMGNSMQFAFPRANRKLRPEDLSAEVLKDLKATAKQKTGEDLQAAVITVPAIFLDPQCQATRAAAELAGFKMCRLLLEPVAAALAYGFQKVDEKAFWLVYDFGGGTFDAAVLHVREGSPHVVSHGGNRRLGGQDIDRCIVNEIVVPALLREYQFPGLEEGDKKWDSLRWWLKSGAEQAKIELSTQDSYSIDLRAAYMADARGKVIDIEIPLSRTQVARLAEPFVVESLNICRQVLKEAKLDSKAIERVVLVGGPTQAPYFRDRIAQELGIQVEVNVDPMTVVAQGAAIFAGTQMLDRSILAPVKKGEYRLELADYKGVGSDPEPVVAGRLCGVDGSVEGYTLEFINEGSKPQWQSGKITLRQDGAFMTTLLAEKGRVNVFRVDCRDPQGTQQIVSPSAIEYTIGLSVTDQGLTESLGLALSGNRVLWIARKGTAYPIKKRLDIITTAFVKQGADNSLRLPVIQGDQEHNDLNPRIYELLITGRQIKRDLPAGSRVEVLFECKNVGQKWEIRAYVEMLDEEFSASFTVGAWQPDIDETRKGLEEWRARVEALRSEQADNDALAKIDKEKRLERVENAVKARNVNDADNDLIQLRRDLHSLLKDETLRQAVASFEYTKKRMQGLVQDAGNESQKRRAADLLVRAEKVIPTKDEQAIRDLTDDMMVINREILHSFKEFWVSGFQNFAKDPTRYTDQAAANELIRQGRAFLQNGNLEGLKRVVQGLVELLPDEDPNKRGYDTSFTA